MPPEKLAQKKFLCILNASQEEITEIFGNPKNTAIYGGQTKLLVHIPTSKDKGKYEEVTLTLWEIGNPNEETPKLWAVNGYTKEAAEELLKIVKRKRILKSLSRVRNNTETNHKHN